MLYDAQIPEGDSVLVGLAGRRVQWATPKAEKSTIILGGNCHQGGSASSTPSTVEVAISTESFEVAVFKDGNMVRDCPSPIQTRKNTHTHTHTCSPVVYPTCFSGFLLFILKKGYVNARLGVCNEAYN